MYSKKYQKIFINNPQCSEVFNNIKFYINLYNNNTLIYNVKL